VFSFSKTGCTLCESRCQRGDFARPYATLVRKWSVSAALKMIADVNGLRMFAFPGAAASEEPL
jgi:hypothetical protein